MSMKNASSMITIQNHQLGDNFEMMQAPTQNPIESELLKQKTQSPSQMPIPPPCLRTSSYITTSWCGFSDMSDAPNKSHSVGKKLMLANPSAKPVKASTIPGKMNCQYLSAESANVNRIAAMSIDTCPDTSKILRGTR